MKLDIKKIVKDNTSHQDIAVYVLRHLLKQKIKSMDSISDVCLYHHPEGLSCAVGCLIPKRTDTRLVEKTGASSALFTLYKPAVYNFLYDTGIISILTVLQFIHDKLPTGTEFSIQHFRRFLSTYQKRTGLDILETTVPAIRAAIDSLE